MDTQSTKPQALRKIAITYSMLGLGDILVWNVVNNWLTYFYLSENNLMPAGLFSVLMFLNGFVGVAIALPIGYWSDHIHSRWGRRLPFLFVTALPRLLLFVLLWTPPVKTESLRNVLYLGVIALAHEIIAGLHQIPNKALLPEITRTDQERVRVSAWAEAFIMLGVAIGSLAGMLIERLGYVTTAAIYAAICLLLFYLPLLVLREPPHTRPAQSAQGSFRQSLSHTFANRAFRSMTAVHALIASSVTLVQIMFPFIVTRILGLTVGDTTYFYLAGLLASLVCYPLVTWLAERLGKQRVFAGSLIGATVVLLGLLLLGDWLPGSLLLPGIVWVVLEAMTVSGATVLQAAFIAEIVSQDAIQMGQHREGTYYATLDFVDRIVYALAGALPAVLLLVGRATADPQGVRGIRMAGVLGSLLTLGALLIFRKYILGLKLSPVEQGA
ncbi:MAG TPA: MFS transporter [Anaerolineae bacterium]|nr:MFS transporter [Anaerolineae bacterium]HQI86555.1 MFS transporter [Anaerolineae bacterium]